MESKIAGLLGAVAALGTITGAQASSAPTPNPSDTLRASSYADLLEPIPNALAVLRAVDAAEAARSEQTAETDATVVQVQYHHHHNRWRRHHHHHNRWWFRHHHHHHHNRWWRHHHHHHHRGY